MAFARTDDRATSQRAAASIPTEARDKNAPTPELKAAVTACIETTPSREFNQPQIVALMNTTANGIRPDNGERWSEQRVRGCLKWMEVHGLTVEIDDTQKYSRFRYVAKVEVETKAIQREMFG